MKTSLAPDGTETLDRATAWACTVTNALTLPGLGSLTAGRSIGYCQGGVALVGFALTMYWFVKTIMQWMAEGQLPAEFSLTLAIGLTGVGIFGVAWLWALGTSLSLLREAKARETANRSQPQPIEGSEESKDTVRQSPPRSNEAATRGDS